jgi:hypothetical protein
MARPPFLTACSFTYWQSSHFSRCSLRRIRRARVSVWRPLLQSKLRCPFTAPVGRLRYADRCGEKITCQKAGKASDGCALFQPVRCFVASLSNSARCRRRADTCLKTPQTTRWSSASIQRAHSGPLFKKLRLKWKSYHAGRRGAETAMANYVNGNGASCGASFRTLHGSCDRTLHQTSSGRNTSGGFCS